MSAAATKSATPKPAGKNPAARKARPAANVPASGSTGAPPGSPGWTRWLTLFAGVMLLAVALAAAWKQPPNPDPLHTVAAWDVANPDWWRYPVEHNAFRRLPTIRGDLTALHVSADGSKLWAAGAGGLIVHSPDGGVTWVQQLPRVASPPPAPQVDAGGFWGAAWAADASATQSVIEGAPVADAKAESKSLNRDDTQTGGELDPKQQAVERQKQEDRAAAEAQLLKEQLARPEPQPIEKKGGVPDRPKNLGKRQTNTTPPTKPVAEPPATPPPPAIPPDRPDFSAIHFADDAYGWAAGEGGAIYATRDGGANWVAQDSTTDQALNGIQFLDRKRGFAVGNGGVVLATTDGGERWERQIMEHGVAFHALQFVDPMRGWIAGGNDVLLATRDGGKSWGVQKTGELRPGRGDEGSSRRPYNLSIVPAALLSLAFVDASQGWVVSDGGGILATRDGGATWMAQKYEEFWRVRAVRFFDANRGWATWGDGILQTRDGGRTWEERATGTAARLATMQFVDANRGWAVGADGTVLATRDGGESWTPLTSGTSSAFTVLRFQDAQRGLVVGKDGVILTTRDAGVTWERRLSGTTVALHDMDFVDASLGWVVGDGEGNAVLATSDGGRSWVGQTRGNLAVVDFINERQGWATSLFGSIFATRDGGETWVAQMSGLYGPVVEIRFADALNGIAVFADGMLRTTGDGGKKWDMNLNRVPSSAEKFSETIHAEFSSLQSGWVVVRNRGTQTDTLHATNDGGKTWTQLASGTINAAQLRDDGSGWTVGDNGAFAATSAGGASWTPQAVGTESALRAVTFIDARTGWVAGDGGALLATRDGGKTWRTPEYAVFPAPWIYFVGALGFGLLLFAARAFAARPAEVAAPGLAELFVSDDPLTYADTDRLGHDTLVDGLANFLLNRNTMPSLTLAITASWGQGKSSIMQRMRHRLDQNGYRTAWFNAWHHQQEGRQLPAMLNAIHRQAVPPWYSPRAWRVRGSLLWHRGGLYQFVFVVALGLLVLALLELPRLGSAVTAAWEGSAGEPQRVVATLATLKAQVWEEPAVLTATSVKKLRADAVFDDDAVNAISSHMVWSGDGSGGTCKLVGGCRFASTAELTASLEALIARPLTREEATALDSAIQHPNGAPASLLSVILGALVLPLLLGKGLAIYGFNYLDLARRLLPGQAQSDSKEAVGTIERIRDEFCRLTLALDQRLVLFVDDIDRCECATVRETLELLNYLTSVGKCFVVVGCAMEQVSPCIAAREGDPDPQGYAARYLKKLINIEVPVPALRREKSDDLLRAQADDATRPADVGAVKRWVIRGVVAAMVCAAAWFMHQMLWPAMNASIAPRAVVAVTAPTPTAASTEASAIPEVVEPTPEPRRDEVVGISPTPEATRAGVKRFSAAVLLAVLLAVTWASRLRWRRWLAERGWLKALKVGLGNAVRTEDSEDFRRALAVWHPVIARGDPSPRGIKRFVNRVRLFAMLEAQYREGRLPDALLVALHALDHAGYDIPESVDDTMNRDPWLAETGGSRTKAAVQDEVRAALRETPGWPPTPAQRERFVAQVAAIHVR